MSTWSRGPGRATLPRSASSWSGIDSRCYRACAGAGIAGGGGRRRAGRISAGVPPARQLPRRRELQDMAADHHVASGDQPAARSEPATWRRLLTPRTEEEGGIGDGRPRGRGPVARSSTPSRRSCGAEFARPFGRCRRSCATRAAAGAGRRATATRRSARCCARRSAPSSGGSPKRGG